MARLLGWPGLMPWQQQVADVALEIDPGTGRLAYRDIRVTVPRQSGKTSLMLSLAVFRMLAGAELFDGPQRIVYGAQNRNEAMLKFRDEFSVRVMDAPSLAKLSSVRLSNGSESLRVGSGQMSVVAPTMRAGHGKTLDLALQDEAFALVDDRMDQALRPAMITRPQAQMWVVSTAGTETSTYLWGKVSGGREAVEQDSGRGIAHFEWSAGDDEDVSAPDTWLRCMPAVGHTIEIDAIAAEAAALPPEEFARAYLNRWPATRVVRRVDADAWAALADRASALSAQPVLAVDISPDRSSSAIAACGASSLGGDRAHVEVIRTGPGVSWVVPELDRLVARHGVRQVALDDSGPAGGLLPQLARRGIRVVTTGGTGMTQACGLLHDQVDLGGVVHLGDERVEAALRGAASRPVGDAWVWRRRSSEVDISPLVAVTVALWAWTRQTPVELSLVGSI